MKLFTSKSRLIASRWLIAIFILPVACDSDTSDTDRSEAPQKTGMAQIETVEYARWLRVTPELPRRIQRNAISSIELTSQVPPRIIEGHQRMSCFFGRSGRNAVTQIAEWPQDQIVRANLREMLQAERIELLPTPDKWRTALELLDEHNKTWKATGFFIQGWKEGYEEVEFGLWRDADEQIKAPSDFDKTDYYVVYFELPIGSTIIAAVIEGQRIELETGLRIE